VVIQTASLQAIYLKTMRNSSSSKFETLNLGIEKVRKQGFPNFSVATAEWSLNNFQAGL